MADTAVLTLVGERSTSVRLAFELPSIAERRYPSQLGRFSGLHEVSAFADDNSLHPIKAIAAQAFERQLDLGGDLQNYVTVLGRIDASLVFPRADSGRWPSDDVLGLRTGLQVEPVSPQGVRISIPPDTLGTGLISFERLYASTISSRARLDIERRGGAEARGATVVLTSQNLLNAGIGRAPSILQQFSDWWTNLVVTAVGLNREPVTIGEDIRGRPDFRASVTASRALLPNVATRAFLWLSLMLLLAIILAVIWGRAILRIHRIVEIGYRMTVSPSTAGALRPLSVRRDQIGTLARTFDLLIRRGRSRNTRLIERMKREAEEKQERTRIDQERTKSHQAILEAIGHEIRSPLQSLLMKTYDKPELGNDLERMRRAVEALSLASSVEAAFKEGTVSVKPVDIGAFLGRFAANCASEGKQIRFHRTTSAAIALVDPITLDQVLNHLVDNAIRHKTSETFVELRAQQEGPLVRLEVWNQGPHISDDKLEEIFRYGFTSGPAPQNRGIGLFACRLYLTNMGGSIQARNTDVGVSFDIFLPAVRQ